MLSHTVFGVYYTETVKNHGQKSFFEKEDLNEPSYEVHLAESMIGNLSNWRFLNKIESDARHPELYVTSDNMIALCF